jgi:hypothetical protein
MVWRPIDGALFLRRRFEPYLIAGQGRLETWPRRCLEPCLETRDFGRHDSTATLPRSGFAHFRRPCPAVPWGEHFSAVKLGVPWFHRRNSCQLLGPITMLSLPLPSTTIPSFQHSESSSVISMQVRKGTLTPHAPHSPTTLLATTSPGFALEGRLELLQLPGALKPWPSSSEHSPSAVPTRARRAICTR